MRVFMCTQCIGVRRTLRFFLQKRRLRGSVLFFGGIVFVIAGKSVAWTFVGLALEAFGFLNLFGDFFPFVVAFMRRLPVIGRCLNAPPFGKWLDKWFGRSTMV